MFRRFGFQYLVWNLQQLFWGGYFGAIFSTRVAFTDIAATVPAIVGDLIQKELNLVSALPVLTQTGSTLRPTLAVYPPGQIRNRLPFNNYGDPTLGAIAAAGSELIPGGLFVSDMGGFTSLSTGTGSAVWSNSGGVGHLAIAGGASGVGIAEISFAVEAGVTYTLITTNETAALSSIIVGTTSGASNVLSTSAGTSSTLLTPFTPAATGTVYLQFRNTANTTSNVYVVSCRQQRLPILAYSNWAVALRSLITVVSTQSDNGVPSFDLRYQVPVTGGSNGGSNLYHCSTTAVAALSGETWTVSQSLAITGGSLTNITSILLGQIERGTGTTINTGSDIKGSLTSSLQSFTYSVALHGGGNTSADQSRIGINHTVGVLVDLTLRYSAAQLEKAAAATATQIVTAAWNITEPGTVSFQSEYWDGADGLTTGVQSFGGSSLRFEVGQPFTLGFIWRTLATGLTQTIAAQCGSGATTTRSMQLVINTSNQLRVIAAGATNDITAYGTVTDGLFHAGLMVWDGVSAATVRMDALAQQTVTVGAAAVENQNITVGCRTDGTFTSGFSQFAHVVFFINKALTAAEQNQALANMKSDYGTV